MKRNVYILSWVILGLLLSMLVHAFAEVRYIDYLLSHGIAPEDHTFFGLAYCALPVWVQSGLLLAGAVGGFYAGVYFWKVVYIEKRRWHRYGKKRN